MSAIDFFLRNTTYATFVIMLVWVTPLLTGCDEHSDPATWLPDQSAPHDANATQTVDARTAQEEDDSSALERVLVREGGVLQMQLGDDAVLPVNFPTDIPLPDGMTLEAVNQLGENRAFNVMGYSDITMSSLIDDIRERGEALGWKKDEVLVSSEMTYLATYSKGKRYFQITLRSSSENKIDFVLTTATQD